MPPLARLAPSWLPSRRPTHPSPLPCALFPPSAVLGANPKVLSLALLVVSYGVSHRLFEFAWKGQLRVLYPTQAAYQSILADVSIATGWATITFMLLVSAPARGL